MKDAHGLHEISFVDHLVLGAMFVAIAVPSMGFGYVVAELVMPLFDGVPLSGFVYRLYHFGIFVAAASLFASALIRGIIVVAEWWSS